MKTLAALAICALSASSQQQQSSPVRGWKISTLSSDFNAAVIHAGTVRAARPVAEVLGKPRVPELSIQCQEGHPEAFIVSVDAKLTLKKTSESHLPYKIKVDDSEIVSTYGTAVGKDSVVLGPSPTKRVLNATRVAIMLPVEIDDADIETSFFLLGISKVVDRLKTLCTKQ